jgi:CubicO group peptidase (beta-lactamase class C family)
MQAEIGTVSLENWLTAPFNRTAFRRVREILPVAEIANDPSAISTLPVDLVAETALPVPARGGENWTLSQFLVRTYTDAFLILHEGRIAFEWYSPQQASSDEHLIFSVTKSLVGSLTGILVADDLVDPLAPVTDYVPELRGSGYDHARVRDLLDMTVSLDFAEAYLSPDSSYARYREATGWHQPRAGQPDLDMHTFLGTIAGNGGSHGRRFDYLSPNSDLLGWICERAAARPLVTLLSQHIWQPIGAQSNAFITLDRSGAARAAGGVGCTLRDMGRFGECMRMGGRVGDRQVIPEDWVKDIRTSGDKQAWTDAVGDAGKWIPGGCYRSQWWITNDAQDAYFAAGIYGQWIYISPSSHVVIVKQSSWPIGPADERRFRFELDTLGSLARRVG